MSTELDKILLLHISENLKKLSSIVCTDISKF